MKAFAKSKPSNHRSDQVLEPNQPTYKKGLSTLAVFAIMSVLWLQNRQLSLLLAILALLAVIAAVKPLATEIGRLWFVFAEMLGRVVSPVIMGLFFFLVLTPWSFVFRKFNADTLRLDPKLDTALIDVTNSLDAKSLEDPF